MKTKGQGQIRNTSHDGKNTLGYISHTRRNRGRNWRGGNSAKGKRQIKRLHYQRAHKNDETSWNKECFLRKQVEFHKNEVIYFWDKICGHVWLPHRIIILCNPYISVHWCKLWNWSQTLHTVHPLHTHSLWFRQARFIELSEKWSHNQALRRQKPIQPWRQRNKGRFTHSMPFPCRTHAVPLPWVAAKGLECVFPIWFTQCGRVWFTLTMQCHAPTMPFFSRPQDNTAVVRRPCCAVALRRTGWSRHGTASVNQTRPHCANQTGKTHSKPSVARHGRGRTWARHAVCESALASLMCR